jgi:hypothetical protein
VGKNGELVLFPDCFFENSVYTLDMKKIILFVLILIALSCSVFAQGLYLDLNLGGGFFAREDKERVKEEGERVDDSTPWTTGGFFYVGAGGGYAPFKDIPLFFAGEYKFYFLKSHYVGAGAIYYPFSNMILQLGTTLGYAWEAEKSSEAVNGFMLNVHAALSLDANNDNIYFNFGPRYSLRVDNNIRINHMLGFFLSFSVVGLL